MAPRQRYNRNVFQWVANACSVVGAAPTIGSGVVSVVAGALGWLTRDPLQGLLAAILAFVAVESGLYVRTRRQARRHDARPRHDTEKSKKLGPTTEPKGSWSEAEGWPVRHTVHAEGATLEVERPEGDAGALLQCTVVFEGAHYRYGLSVARLAVDVDSWSVEFPAEFHGGAQLVPMRRGTYRYTWAADYGVPQVRPDVRPVAKGEFRWP